MGLLCGRMIYLTAFLIACFISSGSCEAAASATEIEIDVVEACADKEEGCAGWASENYCTIQRDLMSYYCPATCGFCNAVQEATDIMTEIVETMVDATDSTTRGWPYEDSATSYNNNDLNSEYDNYSGEEDSSYDSNYDSSYDYSYESSYDSSYDEFGNYDVNSEGDQVTPAIRNHCMGEVRNGELKDMSPSSYGYVECEEGFTRTGPYYIYCNEQGMITGDIPTCERKCSEIKIAGGSIEPPENEKQGWLYVSCNEGYTLEGNAWNWCDRGVVDVIPKCLGGAGEQTSPDTSSETGEYEKVEEMEEKKEEVKGSYGGCPLKEVEHGVWTDPYETSTYWILECKTGYVKNGGDTYVYCDEQKKLSGVAPQCDEDKCANVKVANGVVTSSGTGDWLWVKVECNAGYSLSGTEGTYCSSSDGTLSGTLGTCNM